MNLPFQISDDKKEEIKKLKIIPKGRAKFEIGDIYNHLTILGRAENAIGYNNTFVYAICDCSQHNIIRVQLNKLKNNTTVSCGCEHKKITAEQGRKSCINMINKIVGDFKIVNKTDERDSGSVVWIGECVYCGEFRKISQRNMKNSIVHPNVCSCQKRGGSSFERKIEKLLNENNISFMREKVFDDFVYEDTKQHPRFDFYLKDYNCLIEIHGRQHYEQCGGYMRKENLQKRKIRDSLKIQYALNNNYNIIIIPYTQIDNISCKELLPATSNFIIRSVTV